MLTEPIDYVTCTVTNERGVRPKSPSYANCEYGGTVNVVDSPGVLSLGEGVLLDGEPYTVELGSSWSPILRMDKTPYTRVFVTLLDGTGLRKLERRTNRV